MSFESFNKNPIDQVKINHIRRVAQTAVMNELGFNTHGNRDSANDAMRHWVDEGHSAEFARAFEQVRDEIPDMMSDHEDESVVIQNVVERCLENMPHLAH